MDHRPKVVLDETSYLILNDGKTFDHGRQGTPEIESLTIFFDVDFAKEVLSTQIGDADLLHFDCLSSNRLPINFFERLRKNDNIVTPRLMRIRSLLFESAAEDELHEEFKIILLRLLHVHRADVFTAEGLPFQRSSTKLLMFDRLYRARDYISSALDENWTLPNMAETVGFSPFHFQRCFTQMFGESPHQFLTNCRLSRASMMLKKSDKSVTQICGEIGFESLGSFSTLFCQRYGVSPIRFRSMFSEAALDPSSAIR